MADYWEARASRPHGGPNGEGTNYVQPDFGGVDFAVPQTIEEIRQKIMNQHPEDMAALADQWQNAYNLLSSIKQQLLDQSTTLYNEYWRDARARAEFMRRGPGETLAYLDEWMDSAMNNVTALRGLATIAQNSRDRMDVIWQQYQDDVAAAEDISAGDWARGAGKASFWFGEWNGMDGAREVATEDIQAAHEKANSDARALAEDVGREYTTYFSSMSSGHGPPFYEMNAVLNAPGHPPWPTLPSVSAPPGAPGAPPPLALGPMPGAPPTLAQAAPAPPPTAAPAPPPVGGAPPPPVPAPAVAPAPPPGLPGPVIAPVPGLAPAPPLGRLAPGTVPLPQTPPAQLPPGLPGGAARPPALRGGVLQGSGTPSPSAPPMPPQGGRTLGRTPPRTDPAAPGTEHRGTAVPSNVDETFTPPPTSTAPPVLNNTRPGPGRPGERQPVTPVRHPGHPDAPVPWRPADTAPPVLNSPGRTPGHLEPPVPGRPGRGRSDGPGRTAPGPTPGTEWIGSEAARTDTTAPVLDAPMPPRPGSVSRLEEVPSRLRRRPDAASRPDRKGVVPTELSTRRTKAAAPDRPTEGTRDEAPRIVTDEDAFGVETPGGGVLAKQSEDRSYRPEPPAAITGA